MSNTTHTPVPWSAQKSAVYWTPEGGTAADGCRPIASCHDETHGRMAGEDTYPQDCANAKFIAHAVNCHDDLLAALEAAQNYFSAMDVMRPGANHGTVGAAVRLVVKDAIAKARGQA